MSDEKTFEEDPSVEDDGDDFTVADRRHWKVEDGEEPDANVEPAKPSVLDEYRLRAEEAERKLLEYIEAFKRHQNDQDQVRQRLTRDVERKVELQFGGLVGELLVTVDDLDLSLRHVSDVPEARPLAEGVMMTRDRFLAILLKHGVERISPEGQPFDPNESEALRVDPVDSKERDQTVTETLKPGYRLGARVIRAAQVAVGRYTE